MIQNHEFPPDWITVYRWITRNIITSSFWLCLESYWLLQGVRRCLCSVSLICRIRQASRRRLFKFTAIIYSLLPCQGFACRGYYLLQQSRAFFWLFRFCYTQIFVAVIIESVIPAFTQCRHNLLIALPILSDESFTLLSCVTFLLPYLYVQSFKHEKACVTGFTIFLLPDICTYCHMGSPHRYVILISRLNITFLFKSSWPLLI